MSPLIYVALAGWGVLVPVLFAFGNHRVAALFALVAGYLILPQAVVSLPGMLDLTPTSAVSVGLLLAIVGFDSVRLVLLRPVWGDLPLAVWCLSPLGSSISNGLGLYDGLSGVLGTVLTYGVPYLAGRLYLSDRAGLRDLAKAIVLGAVAYIPLCAYELRFSPQLHRIVYGAQLVEAFTQSRRFGGWRPIVFLPHGLCVGMWMAVATVVAATLRRQRVLEHLGRIPMGLVVLALAATTVLCKSAGAIVLAASAVFVRGASRWTRTTTPLLLLVLLAPAYLGARVVFRWDGDWLTESAREVNPERAASLSTRVETDSLIVERAMERPVFGWGGWSRLRQGLRPILTDTLWALTLGQRGLVGLVSLFGALVFAQTTALRRLRLARGDETTHPEVIALVVLLAMHTLDSLVNAMVCPVFIAAQGALIGWATGRSAPSGR